MSKRQANARRLAVAWLLAVMALTTPALAQQRVVPDSRTELQLSYAPVVQRVAPSVVNIYTRRIVRSGPGLPFFDDPFFQRFFGDRFLGAPRERVENSLGSGVIVDPDGLIVTNQHVIGGADEVTVALADRREFTATVVGSDERTDLAVLRIDTGGQALPALLLGDSDAIEVGDLVLAIGNPFGVGQTVTSGIVSALARTGIGGADAGSFIQTDAAINPGNSGGALVTLDAKLIGINTLIYSRSGGSIGIGFAIPSNLVRVVVDSLVAGGQALRAWLGAWGQAVGADLAKALDLDRPVGVLIDKVYPGGPADRAGLELGDVVIAVDGHEIYDPQGLAFRFSTRPLDGKAELSVARRGKRLSLKVALEVAPETPPRDLRQLRGPHPLAGATVGNLSPAFAEELGVDATLTGVIVVGVSGGPAARLGLQPGDLIAEVDGVAIDSTATLETVLARALQRWSIAVSRAGEVLRVVVEAG